MKRVGAFSSQTIRELMGNGILGAQEANIKPASLDLSLSEEIYQVDGFFKPQRHESVKEVLGLLPNSRHKLTDPLQVGKVYVVRLNESLDLPHSVYAYANPKSSSGRIDMHVRLIADGTMGYDEVSRGSKCNLWLVIVPKTFEVIVSPGITLNQIRFFNADTRFEEADLEITMGKDKLVWNPFDRTPISYESLHSESDGMINLSLDLAQDILGYRAIPGGEPIDLTKTKHYPWQKFFEPLRKTGGTIHFQEGQFYILSSLEMVRVPPHLACEMIPMHERNGEFRSHYAGFIDPGWGYGEKGEGRGRQLTLEVRPFENVIARHGDPFAKIRFERMVEIPEQVYDAIGSNYSVQTGPTLGKYFA